MPRWFLVMLVFAGARGVSQSAEPSREALEFFEKRVRPVLVEHCHKCHGDKQQKGGLRLDSLAAVLKGGESGPAVVPGEPQRSLLIEVINYDPAGYQMPPAGKLSDDVIAALTEWVRLGAPWPADQTGVTAGEKLFDLRERAQHWSFQPVRPATPPETRNADWPLNPIDRFILARLESAGLRPAPAADRRVLLRRVTFELTGLPPTPEELKAFVGDDSAAAYETAVDRLLASPRYGERWARHWLDLVRFAETGGHEFDYDIRHAWPYRDYVVRAFNADVPFDQFVREQIAGDLLPEPRRDPATQALESPIGTAFYWFGQGKHSPVDLRAEECDTVDNQLDVLGKTFLGLTVACARCHDHKFDPITQKDYYALAGFLQSSRQTFADVSPPERAAEVLEELGALTRRHQAALWEQSLAACREFVERLPELLLGRAAADREPLPAEFLAAWRKSLEEEARDDRSHPFHLWVHWDKTPESVAGRAAEWQRTWQAERRSGRDRRSDSLSPPQPFGATASDSWFYDGLAFRRPESRGLTPIWNGSATRPLGEVVSDTTWAHSGTISGRLHGVLRSPTFTITRPVIEYLACRRGGERPSRPLKNGQIHLVIDGFQYIKDPLYGQLSLQIADGRTPKWHRQDVNKFVGSRAYIEIEDYGDGDVVLERVEMHDGRRPADPFHPLISRRLAATAIQSLDDVAQAYQAECLAVLEALRREQLYGARPFAPREAAAGAALVNWLFRQPALPNSRVQPSPATLEFTARRQELEARWPVPQYSLAMTDGSEEEDHLLIRGNPHKPGEIVPRRFLEIAELWVEGRELRAESQSAAVGGPSDSQLSTLNSQPPRGSGRLELADAIADPRNPLTARVLVNRLWQHHFGRGLVPTPDDFGRMGQPPSHPELLDWLAHELVRSGWSLKHLQRLMVTSQTYRMSSRGADVHAEEVDPENLLLHRMNIQRLEAEAIRDAILALSGGLDDRMGGPGVPPHLTPFMEGRGRPRDSGPLDGAGRRSLYINVRRNFLPPLFLAFDFPTPFSTMGRRTASNVPAQALALMNNPFVAEQAARWSQSVAAKSSEPAERIRRLYEAAFSREPTDAETAAATAFVAAQSADYGGMDAPRAWQDLAHVLLNVKEFVYVE